MPNYHNPSLHIWAEVGDGLFEAAKVGISYSIAQQHLRGKLTDEVFVSTIFELQEQASEAQTQLLGATLILSSGGSVQVRASIGEGGSQSDLSWSKNKTK